MDFSKRDTRAIDEARELHLRDPSTGEPIMDEGRPCLALVRPVASRSVQAEIKADLRARVAKAKGTKGKDEDARALEDIHQDMVKSAARLIAGFRNIEWNGVPATAEHAPLILDCNFISLPHLLAKDDERNDGTWRKPSFAQQVLDFAADEENWLGESAAA